MPIWTWKTSFLSHTGRQLGNQFQMRNDFIKWFIWRNIKVFIVVQQVNDYIGTDILSAFRINQHFAAFLSLGSFNGSQHPTHLTDDSSIHQIWEMCWQVLTKIFSTLAKGVSNARKKMEAAPREMKRTPKKYMRYAMMLNWTHEIRSVNQTVNIANYTNIIRKWKNHIVVEHS